MKKGIPRNLTLSTNMEDNNKRVAELLQEASELLLNNNPSSSSSTSIQSAVNSARNMLTVSANNGTFSRLNRNQRLRASSSTQSSHRGAAARSHPYKNSNNAQGQAKKKVPEKAMEFAMIKPDEDDEEEDTKCNLKWDSVIANGIIMVSEEDGEFNIRSKIARSLIKKFPLIGSKDFDFVKVRRKEITRMNLDVGMEYGYSVVKKMAGQGLLYVQVKEMYKNFLNDDSDDDDDDETSLPKILKPASSPQVLDLTNDDAEKKEENSTGQSIHSNKIEKPNESNNDTSRERDEMKNLKTDTVVNSKILNVISGIKESNIYDPVEILRYLQHELHKGRTLDLTSIDGVDELEGETNFISVDRANILLSTFQEMDSVTDFFITYEIDFYGELAKDYGGPRREWLRLCCAEIKKVYFDSGLKKHMSKDYYFIGVLIATSLLQGGPTPKFLCSELIDALLQDTSDAESCIRYLRKGMNQLGMVDIVKSFPQLKHLLMLEVTAPALSVKKLIQTLKPNFSETGSFKFMKEKEVYTLFIKYIREVASGRRVVNLSNVLSFVTGSTEEPLLGFSVQPSIEFVPLPNDNKSNPAEGTEKTTDETEENLGKKSSYAFIPKCHTCGNVLQLPIPDLDNSIPPVEELFSVYDMGFINTHFGLV